MTKLAVLVSGTGSILEAIIASGLNVDLVVADRPCRGLTVATEAGIESKLLARSNFGQPFERDDYTQTLVKILEAHHIRLVAMAGFMTVLGESIFEKFEGKILNTHPSLLPLFRGSHAVEQALEAGAEKTGCTIHVATAELDAGPILAQASVPIHPGDSADTVQERIKIIERTLYPDIIRSLMKEETPA